MRASVVALALLVGAASAQAAPEPADPPAEAEPADPPAEAAPADPPAAPDPARRLTPPGEVLRRAPPDVPRRAWDEPAPAPAGPPGFEALPAGAELELPAEADEDVTVYGVAAIRAARARLDAKMEDLGWEKREVRPDGSAVYAGPEAWLGAAIVSADGLLHFRRRWVWTTPQRPVEMPPSGNIPYADRVARTGEPGVGVEGGLHGPAGQRKVRAAHDAVREGTVDELGAIRIAIAGTAIADVLAALPARFGRLWSEGEPLAGDRVLATPEERRAALVEWWATRPATPEGLAAQRALVDFVVEVVQRSEHPFGADELAAAHARAPEAPRLDGAVPAP